MKITWAGKKALNLLWKTALEFKIIFTSCRETEKIKEQLRKDKEPHLGINNV